MLDFSMEVSLDGKSLSAAEIDALLRASDGLQLIRGRWVEAMRLLAGASLEDAAGDLDADWSQLVAGLWLADTLQGCAGPKAWRKSIRALN